MIKFDTFIIAERLADGSYNLGETGEIWDEVRERLFDVKPPVPGEFCGSVMRAIWMCIYDHSFLLEKQARIKVYDDRGYVRPLQHILLDLVDLAQGKPSKSHWIVRKILGSDNLNDRFIGAANSSGILFEGPYLEGKVT